MQVEVIKAKQSTQKTSSTGAANLLNWSEHVIYHQKLQNNVDS
jgi:hypothetical protein